MDTATRPIGVTERAAEKAIQLSAREGFERPFLRLRVLAGRALGFSYKLSFEEGPADDDHVIEAHGLTVLIDPRSVPIVGGVHHRVHRRHAGRRLQGEQPAGRARVRLRRVLLGLTRRLGPARRSACGANRGDLTEALDLQEADLVSAQATDLAIRQQAGPQPLGEVAVHPSSNSGFQEDPARKAAFVLVGWRRSDASRSNPGWSSA